MNIPSKTDQTAPDLPKTAHNASDSAALAVPYAIKYQAMMRSLRDAHDGTSDIELKSEIMEEIGSVAMTWYIQDLFPDQPLNPET